MARYTVRAATTLLAIGALCTFPGCDRQRDLETVTLPIQHMSPQSAQRLAQPYVIGTGGSIEVSNAPPAMTVKGPKQSIEAIRQLLSRYDAPPSSVQLHFQVIEADGFTGTDSSIADVEGALRELFRFRGYRLAADGYLTGTERSTVSQAIGGTGHYAVVVDIGEVSRGADQPVVMLRTRLTAAGYGNVLESGIAVPNGQTVVLGSARPDPSKGAIILVVRPAIATVGQSPDSTSLPSSGS